jgi:hypothetical protein
MTDNVKTINTRIVLCFIDDAFEINSSVYDDLLVRE